MDCSLSTFPFLTVDEFERACRNLTDRCCTSACGGAGGWSMRLVTQNQQIATSLRISLSRRVAVPSDSTDAAELQESLEDDDPEALVRRNLAPNLHIDYEIVLSPTYRVPVLYFALRWNNYPGPIGLDAVYQYVVPEQYMKELKSVGIMGGISFGYHPESGAPAFFVHPCNTADAMAQIADAQSVTPRMYLLIWLGLVGHCVNLHIPHELVVLDGSCPL